ncbi:MAG: type II secretion system protein GspM [Alphaproteobacteria bacterium]|nr:type II secretion system protein GspM [Alphaproteobacteria bacterium]
MALTLPEGPRGRVLAVGLTALVLAGLWLGVGQPLVQAYGDGADELERRSALASRMAEVAGSLPDMQRALAAQSADLAPAHATLEGTSDALAGAALQSLVESMANSAGGHLTSTDAQAAQQIGAYRRIALRLTVDARWQELMRLVQAIERATPSMFIDDLQIRARPVAAKTREPPLMISFTVEAFRAATSDSAAAPIAPRPSPASGDRP